MEPSDEVLCRRVAEHDERAFATLVERHQDRAYRLAWSILRDAEEAKDLSQEAFLRLYERADRFDGRSKFSTWFHRLLVNLCLDRRRQRSGWLTRLFRRGDDDAHDELDDIPAEGEDLVTTIANREAAAALWKAAEDLSPNQRAALSLHVEGDLSMREIAEALGCAEPTARVHLHRALTALRKSVKAL